ncbi:hypothetical protein DH2020_010236 [Rehmannia glutinosa]|uniref:Uncharacterized protein n=1 Tax=Rehmannia glutinosa TaxID=99300 RepID=A0ABR0X988_REHGL
MTTQVSTKVRLVRCPKCRQVLADQRFYCTNVESCQRFHSSANTTNVEDVALAELSSQETHSVSKSRQDDVLVARSSNNDFVSPPNVESSLDKDNIRCKDENGDSVELCGNFSDELLALVNILSRTKCIHQKSELVEQHNKSHLHQDNRVLQESDNFLSEHEDKESVLLPEGIKDDYVPPENDENSRIGFTNQNGEIKPADENDNVSQSQSAEQSIEAHDGAEGRLIFRREKNTNASIGDSIVSCQSPSKESLVSFYLSSPDNEHLNRFSRETTRNFGRVSSVDTLGTANYPKTESYYAYDGSESSYDGTDDQIRENISRPSRKNKDVDISTQYAQKKQ